jgi:hypothetical protein
MLRWRQTPEDFCLNRPQKLIYSKNLRVGLWEIICHKPKLSVKIGDWQILYRIITCQMEAHLIILESLEPNYNLSMPRLIHRNLEQCLSICERHPLDLTLPCKLQTTYRTFHLLITVLMEWLLLHPKKQFLKVAQTLWTRLTNRKPISTHLTNKRYS